MGNPPADGLLAVKEEKEGGQTERGENSPVNTLIKINYQYTR